MTQTVERKVYPLTEAVPGTWMETTYGQVVYVPFEKEEHRDQFGRVHTEMVQGAHIKRIIQEGGKFVPPPEMTVNVVSEQAAAQMQQDQIDLKAELEALRKEREEMKALKVQLEEERAALREAGKHVKSAAK